MARCSYIIAYFAIFSIVLIFYGILGADNCSAEAGKYDLTPLSRFVWNITRKDGRDIINYKISLCSGLNLGAGDCSNSSVCRLQGNGSRLTNLGNNSEVLASEQDADDKGFWLKFEGGLSPQGERHHSLINLQCGDSLGSPQFIGEYGCSTYFLWKSSAACEYSIAGRRQAVPCYAYDSLGNKYDLSPLAKKKGGYQVKSNVQVIDFFINVCTDISEDEETMGCPSGAGACRKIFSDIVGFGNVSEPLLITDNGNLRIKYTSPADAPFPSGCSQQPSTTVTFVCPEKGMGESPVVLSDSNCDYQIQWVTELACPVKQLESSDGCTLESQLDGIRVDLSALKRGASVIPRNTVGKIGVSVHDFYLGICEGLPSNFPCSSATGNTTTVCRKSMDDPRGLVLGSSVNQSLRYADDQLYLTYTSSTPCQSMSNRTLATVIFFNCGNGRGSDAVGRPRFIQEEDCTTFFEWDTRFACIERMLGGLCFVGDGEHIFDLSSLRRGHAEAPWQAIIDDPWMPKGTQIFINVCGAVGLTGDAANCPAGAAVCLKQIDNSTHDYGQYMTRPGLDVATNDVFLNYTSLEMCGNQTRTTSIKFVCSPGGSGLSPRLVRSASNGCELVIEWPTPEACTQETTVGDNCTVNAPDLGMSFDLSPLRHETFYTVSYSDYMFYLNVCGAMKSAPCSRADDATIGGCQMEKKGQRKFWNIGQASSKLSYYNGIVNLTMTGGDVYNDKNSTARQTVIIFLCDRLAGVGQPKFVNEAHHVYSFKWRTSYVCPTQPIQCIYTDKDTQMQYDLSSLMRTQEQSDWKMGDRTVDKTKIRFYVNVCRRLTLTDKGESGCSSQAGICATRIVNDKEEVYISNLGRPLSGPQFEDQQLVLKFSSGDSCPLAPNRNYSSIIYFMCHNDFNSKPSEVQQGPNFLRTLGCVHMFLWSTHVACPLKPTVQQGNGCSVLDPQTGLTYSLARLNRTFRVDGDRVSEFKSFAVNICGSLNASLWCANKVANDEGVSACGTTNSDRTQVLGLNATRQITVSGEGVVTVSFNGSVDKATGAPGYIVRILFLCRRHLESSAPRFTGQDGRVLLFEYETAITCPPMPVDCTLSDGRGNTYDLSSLKSPTNHWDVRDTRQDHFNIVYHLSVCQPLVVPPESSCPPGVIGACLSNMTSGAGFNLGYVQGTPRMSDDGQGTISLRYLNGDPCVAGGDLRRSTRIDFICSSRIGEPKFVAETAACEYVFAWETPAACSSLQSVGTACQVVDPFYSTRFDFSRLKRSGGYRVVSGVKTFTVSLCGAVPMDCGGDLQAGVCLESDNMKTSGGQFSDQPVYDHGEITLRYGGANRSSIIMFMCDHSTTGEQGPQLFNATSDNNFFMFTWKTSYACRQFKSSSCHVIGPDNAYYDLSQLSQPDDNHEYITYDGTYKYLINVCRSLIHEKDAMCHYGSAVCGINVTEPNVDRKYANLGEVSNGPIFVNGVLKLVYGMGEICRIPGSPILHKQTTIEFTCDPSIRFGEPTLVDDKGCEYVFAWYTAAACPVKEEEAVTGDCTTINPNTGFRFDFGPLRSTSYEMSMNGNGKFHLGVCGGPPSNRCGSDAGSCVEDEDTKKVVSAGVANANLHYHDGVLMLNYSGGEPCDHGSVLSTTIVTFVCGSPSSGHGQPVLVDNINCLYYVSWHTDLACERQVHCSVEVDNEVFDLSSLVEQRGHAYAFGSEIHDDGSYMLNICQPLNPYAGVHCPPGAAACRVDPKTRTAVSLGKVDKSPTVDELGHVVLEYKNGSACLANSHLNSSTKIVFICSGIINSPVPQMVELTSDCTYVFEWPTDVVCPSRSHGNLTSNCTYFDNRSQMHFDLPQLHSNSSSHGFQVLSDEGEFTISLCGSVATQGPCASSGVCLEKDGQVHSWGSATSKIFVYEGHILKVFFKNGEVCSTGGKRISTVWFICDENAGPGKPELAESSECHAVFNWKTAIACPKLTNRCALMHQGKLYDLRLLASHSHSWTITESQNEKFWINVCNGLGGNNDPRCPLGSSACWMSSNGKVQSIGATETQQLSMSADNKTLILKYSTPTNACVNDFKTTTPTYTEIHFMCSTTAGNPKLRPWVYHGARDNCTFVFDWETPLACGELKKQEVLHGGKIEDSSLGLSADLSVLLQSSETAAEQREHDHYKYEINLSGLPEFGFNSKCSGAAICQTKSGDENFQRNLGNANKKKLYIEGSELLIVLESDSLCGRNSLRNVTSRVIMRCFPDSGIGQPVMAYESIDCVYVFNWENGYVCDLISSSQQNVMPISAQGSSHVGIAVGISFMIILVAVAVFFVFRKRERRICFFLSCEPLSTVSSTLMSNRQGHSSISFARLTEEEANPNI